LHDTSRSLLNESARMGQHQRGGRVETEQWFEMAWNRKRETEIRPARRLEG
jgi:hypothetical protein